jgi:hypothetical protein
MGKAAVIAKWQTILQLNSRVETEKDFFYFVPRQNFDNNFGEIRFRSDLFRFVSAKFNWNILAKLPSNTTCPPHTPINTPTHPVHPHSLNCPLTHPLSYSLSLIHIPTHSLTHSITHPLTQSISHTQTPALTHLHTQTCPLLKLTNTHTHSLTPPFSRTTPLTHTLLRGRPIIWRHVWPPLNLAEQFARDSITKLLSLFFFF